MRIDLTKLTNRERVIGGAALVAFIAAFLPWWGVSAGFLSVSIDGWSAGFAGWAGTLLLTAAGVYLLLRRSGSTIPAPSIGDAQLTAVVSGIGLLLVIIKLADLPTYHSLGVGTRYGIWIALVAGIVETVAAVDEARTAG